MASPGGKSELDLNERPVAVPVEQVELDGELVVYNPADHQIHQLDRIGTLVWQFLDGTVTVGELIVDLAEAFSQSTDVVTAAVGALLDELWSADLLAPGPTDSATFRSPDYLSDPPDP